MILGQDMATSADARQHDAYRRASPSQKLAVVARLNAALLGLKEADLKARYPAATAEELRGRLRRWWLAGIG